jgi:hypothetical protein
LRGNICGSQPSTLRKPGGHLYGVYTNHHTGDNIRSTAARKKRKREVKILTFGPIIRQQIRNYGAKKNNSRVEREENMVGRCRVREPVISRRERTGERIEV